MSISYGTVQCTVCTLGADCTQHTVRNKHQAVICVFTFINVMCRSSNQVISDVDYYYYY